MLDGRAKDKHLPKVADFYHGKNVFITGASGFIGTVLLEALLRCCPGIAFIYILLRSKKNVDPEIRKENIFSKKIFDKLKEDSPEMLDKVHVIPGNNALPNLGMSKQDVQLLIEEVSIVFHCAAVLNFQKPLKFILLNNVLSLNTIIELCRKMRNFEALIYTSTAYSNCNHINSTLKEQVIRLPFPAQKFVDALKNNNDEKLQELVSYCKPDWPNSYVFSKCLAENLISDTALDLPIAIIRPSLVISTWRYPTPGYLEGNSGMAALTIGTGKGFVKVIHANPDNKMNFVPVDIVGNVHVIAALYVATKRCASPLVVNCTATEKHYAKLFEYTETITKLFLKCPIPQAFEATRGVIIVPNRYLYYIVAAYHHYLPAVVLDGMQIILGKKPRIYSLYRYLAKVISSVNFFLFRWFEFERNNFENLDKLMHPEDRKELALDCSDATLQDLIFTIPEVSPFYNWNLDKKSPSERQKVKYRLHMMINCIQATFIIVFSLLVYWLFKVIY